MRISLRFTRAELKCCKERCRSEYDKKAGIVLLKGLQTSLVHLILHDVGGYELVSSGSTGPLDPALLWFDASMAPHRLWTSALGSKHSERSSMAKIIWQQSTWRLDYNVLDWHGLEWWITSSSSSYLFASCCCIPPRILHISACWNSFELHVPTDPSACASKDAGQTSEDVQACDFGLFGYSLVSWFHVTCHSRNSGALAWSILRDRWYRASLHVMQHKAEESWWHVARGAVLRFFEAFLEVRLGTLAWPGSRAALTSTHSWDFSDATLAQNKYSGYSGRPPIVFLTMLFAYE